MRAALDELLPDRGNILSAAQTPDGQGGFTVVWGTATANVACRLDIGSKQNYEAVAGAALAPYSWWQLSLPYDAVITEQNRFECNGETFNVVHVDNGKSWALNRRAVLTRV
jgi:hypothetical protein